MTTTQITFRQLRTELLELQALIEKTIPAMVRMVDWFIDMQGQTASAPKVVKAKSETEPDSERWGQKLLDYRRRSRRSKSKMAKRLNITTTRLEDIELGAPLSDEDVAKIRALFGS